ncbi:MULTISPECIES: sirohydrochlorin cobaltochelatase [Clostridium]|uniref:Sirohydrochlorin cobaltochelatase n=1 Tax=Clostridium cibarium TaxID=2762247 RepID=A0ABR8PR91_9CLOT|nr:MULTISPECIES: sirohydrochlorin cobaltochelatase [Clostridium]MBD7910695.1 sirohydrochlorin cobaltochelatase [Clostridium cibarium]
MSQVCKKGLLVVSFGTSYNYTREKNIKAIEDDIHNNYPDYKIYRAFTSNMIIRKVFKRDGIKINTVVEALNTMREDGIEDLLVQPTHILNGVENDLMIEALHKYRHYFNSIKLGNPLLTTQEDYINLINTISEEFSYMNQDAALVCMGHGTTHYVNTTYAALDYMFKEKGFNNIFIGTVEAYPDFDVILKSIKAFNPKKIILMPLMVVAGDHAINDMASTDEDSWKTQFENEGFSVKCVLKGLGEYPSIRKIYVDHVSRAKNL